MTVPLLQGFRPRRMARRRRPGRTTFVVRGVRIRSVAAMAFLFLTLAGVLAVAAGWLLWLLADREGLVGRAERFIEELGFETFEFEPDRILSVGVTLAVGMVVLGTLLAVLAAALLNLIVAAIGGLEVLAEQKLVLAPAPARSDPAVAEEGDGDRNVTDDEGSDRQPPAGDGVPLVEEGAVIEEGQPTPAAPASQAAARSGEGLGAARQTRAG